ncbi:MAG: TetR/AcrR family transcriptional regulator [Fimbriiglobus sp.]
MPWEKQFDQQEVLDKAKRAFWENGYEGTSMAELLDAMGIQKGSFYATFGSKHEVFLDALQRFIDERFATAEALPHADSPRSALESHLRQIAEDTLGCDGKKGCFVANAAVELAPKDAEVQSLVVKMFERHIGLYRRTLDAAVAKGELPESFDSLRVARVLLALILGIRVLARTGMPAIMIHAIRDQAIDLLK